MDDKKIIGIYKMLGEKLHYKNEVLCCHLSTTIIPRCEGCSLNYTKRITDNKVKESMVTCDDVICSKSMREKVSHFSSEYDVIFKRKYHTYNKDKPLYAQVGELVLIEGKLYKCVEDTESYGGGCDIPDEIKCDKIYCSKDERKKIYYDSQTNVIFKRYYRNPILKLLKYWNMI